MDKKKKSAQDTLLASVIGVSATIAFMGGFVVSGDLNKSFNNLTHVNDSKNEVIYEAGAGIGAKTLGFNENRIEHADENYNYNMLLGTYAGLNDSYINVEYGDTKSKIKLVKYHYADANTESYEIEFSEPVVDFHISTFDMNPELNTLLFLLEDGSVEYVLIEEAIETNNFISYGSVDELKNIVKFYEGTKCNKETNLCTKTAFAQNTEGKIVDLLDVLQ